MAEPAPAPADPALTILSKIGLQEEADTFRALLIPFADPTQLTRYEATVGLVGTLMTKSQFPRALVSMAVRDLMKSGPDLMKAEHTSVVSFEGAILYVPGLPSGKFYDIRTLKEMTAQQLPEPLTATSFSMRRAFQVCDGLQ